MSNERKTCETCYFFAAFKHNQTDSAQGGCHFNPPDRPGGFPLVSKNDWCGKWALSKSSAKTCVSADLDLDAL